MYKVAVNNSTFSLKNIMSLIPLHVKKFFILIAEYCTCEKDWTRMQER